MQGTTVWLLYRETEGTVRKEVSPRSYEIMTSQGFFQGSREALIPLNHDPSGDQEWVTGEPEGDSTVETETSPLQPALVHLRCSNRTLREPDRLDPSWS